MRFLGLASLAITLAIPSVACADAISTVGKVLSGEELSLQDGRVVRLAGVHAPEDVARNELEKRAAGKTVALEETSTDRYGRTAAQVFIVQDGKKIWLQGELLRAGLAFVYPPTGNEDELTEMMKAEAEARKAKRGIWSEEDWADAPAAEAGKKYGQFAFVSGTVVKAARIKNKVYLNFGKDWRTDFTITIAAHDLHNFRKANIDPLTYEGKTIRVRGWVRREFGPMINVTHPAQIEVVGNNENPTS